MEDRCVCCGAIIPEGLQVCPNCVRSAFGVRPIDANALTLGKFPNPRTEWHQGWNDALDAAKEAAETVDAVEVVRCKDCKKAVRHEIFPHSRRCTVEDCKFSHKKTHFCSYGERRSTDG